MRLAFERTPVQNKSTRVAEIDARPETLRKDLLKKANARLGFEGPSDGIDALRDEKPALLSGRFFTFRDGNTISIWYNI